MSIIWKFGDIHFKSALLQYGIVKWRWMNNGKYNIILIESWCQKVVLIDGSRDYNP